MKKGIDLPLKRPLFFKSGMNSRLFSHSFLRYQAFSLTLLVLLTMVLLGGSAFGQAFNFNGGTVEGWFLNGAWDDAGGGPWSESFSSLSWYDQANYPNAPNTDPVGDNRGSLYFSSSVAYPVPSSGTSWWIMQLHSPNLSGNSQWQKAVSYSVRLYRTMASGSLYANLYVKVWDFDQARRIG